MGIEHGGVAQRIMNLKQLHKALLAVAPVEGVAIVGTSRPEWHTVTRLDGLIVRIDYSPAATPVQRVNGDALALTWDFSPPAETSRESIEQRIAAIAFLSDISHVGKLIRATLTYLAEEVNVLRRQVVGTAALAWDPPNMPNNTGTTSPNITVAKAAFGDLVLVSAPYSLGGIVATGYVSAPNTVNIRLHNSTGSAVNLPGGTWKVAVLRLAVLPDRTLEDAVEDTSNIINSGVVDS